MPCLLSFMLLAGTCVGPAWPSMAEPSVTGRSWRDQIIYFAFTDRFFDGDLTNDQDVERANATGYHGGDLAGILRKLPYLHDLGVTTVWISPIVQQDPGPLKGTRIWAYHGYWGDDFTRMDPRMGTPAVLRAVVTKAHALDMRVLLDVVCNHTGYQSPLPKLHPAWFHHDGDVRDWNSRWQQLNCDLWSLPDFNQDNPQVVRYLTHAYAGWIRRSGVDGFRVDTVKHVPIRFWRKWDAAMKAAGGPHFRLLGEVFDGDPNFVARYQRAGFDSLFDYPLYYVIDRVFAHGGSMRELSQAFAWDRKYRDPGMLATFLDDHDVPRFLTRDGGDVQRLRLALAFLFSIRGIPTLYYGTETGMSGGNDPDNRQDMAWGQHPGLHGYVRKLCHLRTSADGWALRRGDQKQLWADDQVYGLSRRAGSQEILAFFNNTKDSQRRTVPLRAGTVLTDGMVLSDALSETRVTVVHGQVTVTLGPEQAMILLPSKG